MAEMGQRSPEPTTHLHTHYVIHLTHNTHIVLQASGPQSPPPISIPTLFRQTVERIPNNRALGLYNYGILIVLYCVLCTVQS